MRIVSQFSKVATLVVLLSLSLAMVVWSQETITAYFEGSGSLASTSWSAGDSLVQNGNLHSNAKALATKQIALYKTSGYNQVALKWAPLGDGCTDDGTSYAGIIFLNSASNTGNGYYCYYYNGKIRLYTIASGATSANKGEAAATTPMTAGSEFQVRVNRTTNQFDYYLNGVLLGSLTDGSKTYSLSSAIYGGALLYGGKPNDIEEMTFSVYTPSTVVDTTPPSAATIAAAAASSSSITVTWTAQSDDGGSSGTGTASSYELRYSTSAITSANFSSATKATTGTPKAPGSSESVTVSGLSASTKYYFALIIKDEVPNSSPLSNVASATTSAGGGGGGGGGGTPSLGWNTPIIDDFNRASLGAEWSAPKFIIDNNELAISSSNGYGLAAFARPGANKSAGADSIKLSMKMGASAVYYLTQGYIPAGFAIMLDTPSASANGYWLRRSANKLSLYAISGGSTFNSLIGEVNVTKTAPAAGQKVTVIIKVTGKDRIIQH